MSREKRDRDKEIRYESGGIVIDVDAALEEIKREQAEAKKRDDEYKSSQVTTNRKIVNYTFALVLCTAATGLIAIWQANIARETAGAAKDASSVARDSLVASQRPWVAVAHDSLAVDRLSFRPTIADGKTTYSGEAHALMTLENFGKTPALRVTPPMIRLYLVQNPPEGWEQEACTLVETFSQKGDVNADVPTYFIMPKSTVPTQTQETFSIGSTAPSSIHTYWISICFVYRDSISRDTHHTKLLLFGALPFDPRQRLNVRMTKVD